jgi:hypothetical protein
MDTYVDDDGTIWLGDNASPLIDVALDIADYISQAETRDESAA